MAKIKGVELKALKNYGGHDGEPCFYGNIYVDGTMVGTWRQDSWGGPDDFNFKSKEARESFFKKVEEYFTEHPYEVYYDLTMEQFVNGIKPRIIPYGEMFEPESSFMAVLLNLALDEKQYKKFAKDGYTTFCIFDYYHIMAPIPVGTYSAYSPVVPQEEIDKIIQKEKEKYPHSNVRIFKSLDDFIIN